MKYKRPRNYEYMYYLPPDEVLATIGRIALVAASIEDIIHSIFWRYADVGDSVGQILTGDEKPPRLAEDILKMAIAVEEDPERIEDMRSLFSDFKELNEKRNQCIHWIWYPPRVYRKKRGDTHWVRPPSYKGRRSPISFTPRQLSALACDFEWVELRMRSHAMDEEEFEHEREEADIAAHIVVPAPWLDKHRKPGPIRWSRVGVRKQRLRQLRASAQKS